MAEILLDTQSAPSTPSAGQLIAWPDSVGKRFTVKNENGATFTLGGQITNAATAAVTGYAADTYLAGSAITVPSSLTLLAGAVYRCCISLSKTAAGVATPIFTVRVGTAGTTADTAVLTFTGTAQTAAADVGFVDIECVWRSVGASGVLQGTFLMTHNTGAATGLIGSISPVIQVTGAAFNTTTASLIMGVSANGGASASWTTAQVNAELLNI